MDDRTDNQTLYAACQQAGSDAQIISIGYGKGSVTTVDYATNGVYYPIFMNWAQQLKGKVTFAGIVVMLGITERHLPSDQISGFPARMAAIIAKIRSDLGEPNLAKPFANELAQRSLEPCPHRLVVKFECEPAEGDHQHERPCAGDMKG